MTFVVNVVVTLGMVVILPLGLRLLPLRDAARAARHWPVAGLVGSLAMWLPRGGTATTFAAGYLVCTLVLVVLAGQLAWDRWRDRSWVMADVAAVTALVCPFVAAFALLAERSSHEVFGFSLRILALTVPHFHFAGFAAALVAFLVSRGHPGPLTTAGALSVPLGTAVVLVGYFVNDEVELVGAVILTAGMWLVGWALWSRSRASTGDPVTRILLGTSALTLVVTMLLALDWALGHVVEVVPHLPIEWMAWTHGLANAVGFALCAVLAWTRLTEERLDEAR